MKIKLFIAALAFICTACSLSAQENDRMWLQLEVASETAEFRFNIPSDGCVSIISAVPGRRQKDTLWGPSFMKKGTYRMGLPAGKVVNRSGYIELFNVEIEGAVSIGTRGSGERQFNTPSGVDYDSVRDELLVADTGNDRIIRLSADGRQMSQHGGFGLAMGSSASEREDSLDDPIDVAAGGFSNFYVSDYNNERICIFDFYRNYKGNLYPRTDSRRERLSRPKGIICDSENNIWVVESKNNRVIKFASDGTKLLEVGGYGFSEQQLRDPCQLSLDEYGKIFVADRGKGRIAVYDRLGSYLTEIRDHFKAPSGVSVDPDGLLWICDDSTDELSLCTPKGIRLLVLSQTDDGTELRRPSDVTTGEKHVYVADTGNHRIVAINRKKTALVATWQAASPVLESADK